MKYFSLFQVILVTITVLLNCMIFTLLYSLFTFKTRYIIKEPTCIIEEQDALIKHNVNLSKMYLPFTKFTNKFHNFQAISQHLNNKQDVNILKHTYTYLTSMKSIMTYKTGQDLIQKIITYIQDHVLKLLPQHIFHWIYSLTLQGQLFLQGSWSED